MCAWVPLLIIMGSPAGAGSRSTAPGGAGATLMRQGKERQFVKRESVRLSNSLGKQLGTEVTAGTQQARKETLLELAAADPTGVGTDVERRNHLTGSVVHRDGDRTQPLLELL